jgi:hypothetical protein
MGSAVGGDPDPNTKGGATGLNDQPGYGQSPALPIQALSHLPTIP